MMFSRSLRCVALLTAAVFAISAQPVRAGDVVTVEIHRPLDVWNHPLVKSVRDELAKSRQFQAALATPQFDRVRLLTQLVERGTGEPWETGFKKLTAGGAMISFSPGNKGGMTVVATADDAKTMQRFVTTAREHVRSRLPEQARAAAFVASNRDGVEYIRVGTAAYAVVGPRLVFASTESRMWDAVRELRKQSARNPAKSGRPKPILKFTVEAAALRQIPQVKKALQLPAADAGQMAILGGWFDLLRRSRRITGELTVVRSPEFSKIPGISGDGLELRVRSDAKPAGVAPGLQGFFADGKQRKIAPLLQLPGAIYAASWYRDYRSLWEGRAKLLAKAPLKKLEDGDDTLRKQFSVIGGKALPSRMFSLLGPHFRVVAVRQEKTEYDVELPSRTPAAGMVVDLRNEDAFRNEAFPLFRAIGLLLTVTEAKMVSRKSTYKGAELTSVGHRDDSISAKAGNRLRFNLNVTYTATRGHFVVGTTRTIVEKLIDELDRQARERTAIKTSATEIQHLSLSEAATALRDFQPAILRQIALDLGLSVAEGKAELDVAGRILKALGNIRTQAGYDERGFEYRVRIGK